MSEQIHADKAEEQVSSDSGLFLSAEPLGGERLSAVGDADADATDTTGDDTDSGLGDSDASDSTLTDADATDDEEDEADADGTDGGDSIESESGLGGENPLGLERNRPVGGGEGDDAGDSRDS
jgi:hypothetical protein